MPKTVGTRQQKADELLVTVIAGPGIAAPKGQALTENFVNSYYQLWAENFVIPALRELVPELREKKNG